MLFAREPEQGEQFMSLIIRVWNVTRGLSAKFVSYFERRNPEALLEIEKENLGALIGRFNQNLVSHAALLSCAIGP
jgi:hypothetical protein